MPLRQVAVEGLGSYYLVLTHQFEPHEFETLSVHYTETWTQDLKGIALLTCAELPKGFSADRHLEDQLAGHHGGQRSHGGRGGHQGPAVEADRGWR